MLPSAFTAASSVRRLLIVQGPALSRALCPAVRAGFSTTPSALFSEISSSAPAEKSLFDQPEPDVSPYSFDGISSEPFSKEIANVLLAPVEPNDVEIKPDGLLYLPEIRYRRILLRAFGPGGWALMPKSRHSLDGGILSREYALYCLGRFVAQARGEQQFFEKVGLATAQESVKSNALVRCCKDLGIASELWDPAFISKWKATHAVHVWVETRSGAKSKMWRRKDRTLEGYTELKPK